MERICDKERCTGCAACMGTCPVSAISMKVGKLGALYPYIDQGLCVDCGLCVSVCPENEPVQLNAPVISYSAYASDQQERISSASGGASAMLVETILEGGGAVYGCVQEKGMVIRHIRVTDRTAANLIKGSKYVQSNIAEVYAPVREDLERGMEVLFTGTPCQVAGLRKYLGRDYDNLYLVDLCCHGVASSALLESHLTSLNVDLSDLHVDFRIKRNERIEYGLYLKAADKYVYRKRAYADAYMTGFLSGLMFRENCFSCRYAQADRCADITLADHWAMGKSSDPLMSLKNGLSTILVNTVKGKSLLEKVADRLKLEARPFEESFRNGQFQHPFPKPSSYDGFVELYESKGYRAACQKYIPSLQRRIFFNDLKSRYYKWPLRQNIRKLLKR